MAFSVACAIVFASITTANSQTPSGQQKTEKPDFLYKEEVKIINGLDATYKQEEGSGFLGGLKSLSIDEGKTFVLINTNTLMISGFRNSFSQALKEFDSLGNKADLRDRAKLAKDCIYYGQPSIRFSQRPVEAILKAFNYRDNKGEWTEKEKAIVQDLSASYKRLLDESIELPFRLIPIIHAYIEQSSLK
jgi:hypothetical protein